MLTSIKVYGYYTVNIYNNTQKDNFKWGHSHLLRLSWIRLCFVNIRKLESERAVLDAVRLDACTIFKAFQSCYQKSAPMYIVQR